MVTTRWCDCGHLYHSKTTREDSPAVENGQSPWLAQRYGADLVCFKSFLTIYSSPLDHWASLEINLNQGSDSTELEMVMSNVPQGKETDVQQGLENY
jgi:hypothetical protein